MEKSNIFHNDIKDLNIIIKEKKQEKSGQSKQQIKIIDYGLGMDNKQNTRKQKTVFIKQYIKNTQSRNYINLAPEQIKIDKLIKTMKQPIEESKMTEIERIVRKRKLLKTILNEQFTKKINAFQLGLIMYQIIYQDNG